MSRLNNWAKLPCQPGCQVITRRTFGKLALAAAPMASAWAKIDSTVHGVRIGVSGYSFQYSSLDQAIAIMKSIGLGATEVWFRHIEPKTTREELRAWRLSVPLEEFRKVGKKYDDAGIDKIAFTHDMKDDFTDAELERPFLMAKALGAERIATSTTLTVARRLVPLMEKHRMEVAFHGHTNAADPNEFAGPESFRKALEMSPFARINLDIGQFLGAGFDPVPFIAEEHAKISVLHIRDGIRGQRGKVPWGTGEVPIKEVLQLLKREQYPIVADIEYDYGGATDPLNEVRKCYEYCRSALE